ncbi:MAG: ABC transporter ATP-binding protein [Prolixibacteraceae bacterium]|nr:ABC transporter ATP-binding protein [Prolixibacteraceae bacterium]MBN2648178.1 ABC transporter ATP-binding protein [Prolixibacteraceae bacterium]
MIKVNNLLFAYKQKDKPTLKTISFDVATAEIFGFLGPSGAGKSTTQKVLTGVLKNYNGSVQLNSIEIKNIDKKFYENIGVAFEFPNLYLKFTALENLQLFSSFYTCEQYNINELLKRVGLWNDRNVKVEAFSKGMRMRLNFIRSIMHKPTLLFLDEPTSGLDPSNSRLLKDMIKELRDSGTTIFLTTHNMADADELCDRIAFMIDGELPVIDSPENLKIRHGKKSVKVRYRKDNRLSTDEFELLGLGENEQFLNLISNNEVETIHTQEATIEDIFIKVTGKQLQ